MGITAVFPMAVMFSVSYLLTLRWYVHQKSWLGLFVGAFAQPLFTAVLFTIGVFACNSIFAWNEHPNFKGFALLTIVMTLVVSVPLALIGPIVIGILFGSKISTRDRENRVQYHSSRLFFAAGSISLLCASVAMVLYLLKAS